MTVIREYRETDKNAVIDLIRQNTPEYFALEEEADFSNYLDSERELYFVLLLNKEIVGCGGITFTDQKKTGKISWDSDNIPFHAVSETRAIEYGT